MAISTHGFGSEGFAGRGRSTVSESGATSSFSSGGGNRRGGRGGDRAYLSRLLQQNQQRETAKRAEAARVAEAERVTFNEQAINDIISGLSGIQGGPTPGVDYTGVDPEMADIGGAQANPFEFAGATAKENPGLATAAGILSPTAGLIGSELLRANPEYYDTLGVSPPSAESLEGLFYDNGLKPAATPSTAPFARGGGRDSITNILAGRIDPNALSPDQILALRDYSRTQSQGSALQRLLAGDNPFATEEEFSNVLNAGLTRQLDALGRDPSSGQFNPIFNNPDLGGIILGEELGLRQGTARESLGNVFTGSAFDPIDDNIINSIVEERADPARQQVANFEARGNLNPLGGKTANQFISDQFAGATERVGQVGQDVLGRNQNEINALRDTAEQGIGGFKLGDDLFDVTPFQEQRQGLIDERLGSLSGDISTQLGSEPLFDIGGALSAGGQSQGLVSGGTPSIVSTLASRQGGTNDPNRRGLGTKGSGTF